MQHHPLENPSLAPFDLVFPIRQERLKHRSENISHWVNTEKLIARMWDKCNRSNATKPVPVQTIIHEILPGRAQANRITQGDFQFDGLPYLTRDILVLSSTVQWFGTGVGWSFIAADISRDSIPGFHPAREFIIKFECASREKDMVAFLTHVCTPACKSGGKMVPLTASLSGTCHIDSRGVSTRDRAVVDGLMYWLGQKEGRSFIADYARRKKNALTAAQKRQEKEMSW
jgi:hypothetical protein